MHAGGTVTSLYAGDTVTSLYTGDTVTSLYTDGLGTLTARHITVGRHITQGHCGCNTAKRDRPLPSHYRVASGKRESLSQGMTVQLQWAYCRAFASVTQQKQEESRMVGTCVCEAMPTRLLCLAAPRSHSILTAQLQVQRHQLSLISHDLSKSVTTYSKKHACGKRRSSAAGAHRRASLARVHHDKQ